ncbi:MAG: hypothetical protein WCL29_03000 [Pseudomonadota bacterium]
MFKKIEHPKNVVKEKPATLGVLLDAKVALFFVKEPITSADRWPLWLFLKEPSAAFAAICRLAYSAVCLLP